MAYWKTRTQDPRQRRPFGGSGKLEDPEPWATLDSGGPEAPQLFRAKDSNILLLPNERLWRQDYFPSKIMALNLLLFHARTL